MPVANFSLATHRRWNDRDGNRQEQTEWHQVVCFGRQAEIDAIQARVDAYWAEVETGGEP